MDPVHYADWPHSDVVCVGDDCPCPDPDGGFFVFPALGSPEGRGHVTFGAVSVDLVGAEEVAA